MQRKVPLRQTLTAPASPRQATELLGDLADLRQSTRRSLGAPWFPLIVFGSLTALAGVLVDAFGPSVLLAYWLLASPAGLLAVRRHYRARGRRRGVTGRGRPAWMIGVMLSCLCLAAGIVGGRLGGAPAGLLAPVWIAVAGYVAFGVLQRRVAPALGVAACAAVTTVAAAGGAPSWAVEVLFGAGLIVVGVLLVLAGEER